MEAHKIQEQFKNAMKIAIDNPIDRIQRIVTDEKMSKEDFRSIVNSFTMEPDQSLFGVVNAFTREATHRDGEQAYELSRIGTKLLAAGV
jgi:hypothetical protein